MTVSRVASRPLGRGGQSIEKWRRCQGDAATKQATKQATEQATKEATK